MALDYTVVYSRRKRLTITVERDRSIVVMAPEGVSAEKIREVVESRKLWLYEKTRHSQKYAALPHPPGKELVNGESLPYLGVNYQIELVEQRHKIKFNRKFLVPTALLGQRQQLFHDWYKAKAIEKILPRVRIHAKNLGVTYNQAKIGDGKYRWGSCTPNDNIIFNWRLIKAPMFVIDYVIVHELAHLIELNHTPQFWTIVRVQIANLDKAKAWLKENGGLLELDFNTPL
jgi:predicted metal-dependent hydrolase